MGAVTGPLRAVASEIAEVRNVKVKGMFDRPEDGGITLDDYAKVDYTDGVVTFEALPGAAVLKLDRVSGRVTTIKMIIPEEDCTLEDAVKAGGVADHVDSVRLSQIVHMIETTERNATNAATSAGVAKGHADRAAEENSAAQSAAGRAAGSEANAQDSEDKAKNYEEAAGLAASAASTSAGQADGKATLAGQFADAADQASRTASAQAGIATGKAGEADASANTASNHAAAANTARQGAVAAQGLAETARDEAGAKVQAALDVALPTKADKVHEHTTAQVTGLDTALTDANWYKGAVPAGSTMDSLEPGLYSLDTFAKAVALGLPNRVGSIEIVQSYQQIRTATALVGETNGNNRGVWTNFRHSTTGAWTGWRRSVLTADEASSTAGLDLRIDNSVGTRIFAGNTMIYGDTGDRSVWDLTFNVAKEASAYARYAVLRREGNRVTMRVAATYDGSGSDTNAGLVTEGLPTGFRPMFFGAMGVARWGSTTSAVGTSYSFARLSLTTVPVVGTLIILQAMWITNDPWPTSLPGLPA